MISQVISYLPILLHDLPIFMTYYLWNIMLQNEPKGVYSAIA